MIEQENDILKEIIMRWPIKKTQHITLMSIKDQLLFYTSVKIFSYMCHIPKRMNYT